MIERFVMNMLDKDILKIEILAREQGCTMSWIYRALLFAVSKKFECGLPEDIEIRRPVKFDFPFRLTTICFYGDKSKWFSLARIWQVELSSLIRFSLDLYYKGELELDFDDVKTVKEIKTSNRGKLNIKRKRSASKGCRYLYQTVADLYNKAEYRPKNPAKNLVLMERGLKNRINPLNLK